MEQKDTQQGVKGTVLVGGGQVSPLTAGQTQLPVRKGEQRVQDSVVLKCSGSRAKECGPSPAQALCLPVMPLGAGAETQPAAAWGGQRGRVPQEGRQGVLCPDSLRVLSVAMRRLMAKLPVIVSAIALDVDAADPVPQFKGLLVFTGGRLAAVPAGGLQ